MRSSRSLRCALAAAALLSSCTTSEPQPAVLVVEVLGPALDGLEWSPPGAVLRATRHRDRVELELDARNAPEKLLLRGAKMCDAEVSFAAGTAGERKRVTLAAWLTVKAGELAQLGFDAPFSVVLEPGCRAALSGTVAWRQSEGPALQTRVEQNGFVLHGRTRPLELAEQPGWGIVPLSPRTRGSTTFVAEWRGAGRTESLTVRLAAASRASGLPSIATGQRVLLAGTGWSVKLPARGGTAKPEPGVGVSVFRPDVRGRWLLTDDTGRELSLVAGSHAETPLDCGRSDCHVAETKRAASSNMTTTLFRAVTSALPAPASDCVLGCHTAGEPGLADGGFAHVKRELGLEGVWPSGQRGWDTLPRALRRLGGVTCTACHGPGAIPEPAARWAIVRSDVCATCHDAPPRYGHVSAWRQTRMARADADAETRTRSECRPCHTTAGFLEAMGLRKSVEGAPVDLVAGIACAACHAAHGEQLGRALVRKLAAPRGLGSIPKTFGTGSVCLPCHAAVATLGAGSASSASRPLTSGEPGRIAGGTAARLLLGGDDPPHAAVVDGCIGCHFERSLPGEARGAGHDFQASMSGCTAGCHEGGAPKRDPSLRERALRLYTRLGGVLAEKRPPHATTRPAPPVAAGAPAREPAALELVLEVLEDPAADVHNPARAKLLLDRAERTLSGDALR